MYEKYAVLKNDETINFRPASKFVEAAKKFQSTIIIINDNEHINAKSFRALCASALSKGSRIILKGEGPDEKEAIETLCGIIEQI